MPRMGHLKKQDYLRNQKYFRFLQQQFPTPDGHVWGNFVLRPQGGALPKLASSAADGGQQESLRVSSGQAETQWNESGNWRHFLLSLDVTRDIVMIDKGRELWAGLQINWIGFDQICTQNYLFQTSQNRRPSVQWYFPLRWVFSGLGRLSSCLSHMGKDCYTDELRLTGLESNKLEVLFISFTTTYLAK